MILGLAVLETRGSMRVYIEYERSTWEKELNIIREMRLGQVKDVPGIYAWIGDYGAVKADISAAQSGEKNAYNSVGTFVLPFTHDFDIKRCVDHAHVMRLDSLRALDDMTERYMGSEETEKRYFDASTAYRTQLTNCEFLRDGYSYSEKLDQWIAPRKFEIRKDDSPKALEKNIDIKQAYNSAYSKLRGDKSTADITQSDIDNLANILAHPATEADWRFLSDLDAAETDPGNSCNTGDCAIDQSIIGQAERMIKSAGLVPPSTLSVHFKLTK